MEAIKAFMPYGVQAPDQIPDVADRVLLEVIMLAEKLDIRAGVGFGTCLGFVRDGAYLPGDNDVDVIVIVRNEAEREFLTYRLIEAGFLMGRTYPPVNTHFVKDGILVDVFWREPKGFYAVMEPVTYKTHSLFAPTPINAYLTACYRDWRDKTNKIESVYEG